MPSTNGRTGWWIAGLLAAILVASLPGYIVLLTGVPSRGEFDDLRLQHQVTQEKFATLSERMKAVQEQATTQQLQLNAILSQLANRPGR